MSGMSNSDPRARLMRTAEAVAGPGPFADHRAHDRERHADPHPTEDVRQGGRDLERGQHLARRRAQAASELEKPGIDRADPDHRRDRHREEDDQRADDDLAQQPRPEPQHEQRREDKDRDRLGGHQVRRGESFEEGASCQRVADDQARARRRRRSRGGPRSSWSRNAARRCRRARPRRNARPTVSGRGQDERREAADHDDRLPAEDEEREGAQRSAARPRSAPGLRRHAAASSASVPSPVGIAGRRDGRGSRGRSATRRRCRGRRSSAAAAARPRCRRRPARAAATGRRRGRRSRIASGMLWVTITIVAAARSHRRSSSRSKRSRVSASSALNGSSSSRTAGSSASARARATRWRVPPDSSAGRDGDDGRIETHELGQRSEPFARAAPGGQPASSSG